MKGKASILARSMILTFLLTLLLGSLVVHAEDEVKKTELNFTKATVNIGDEDNILQLKMENQQEGDKKPRWVSYNVNVATVDQNGVVTPLRKGKAIISSGIGFPRKTCVVTVVDPSVKLNKTAAAIYRSDRDNTPGNTVTLTAKVNGATKKATDVEWSSSDESVARVVPDIKGRGVVTSVDGENGKAGEAVITARVNGRTASCKVTVLNSTISLNVDSMQLSTKGAGSSIKLVPTVVGSKKSVKWTSDDRTIATVSGGKVTGKKAGTTTVTAEANGVKKTCEVTVVEGQISINEENVQLYVTKNASDETTGETKELKTNAANSDVVIWTSSDESVVTVEGKTKGKAAITAVSAGRAIITATCNDKTDTCVVKVDDTSTSITEKVVHLKTKGVAKTYTLGYQAVGRKNAVTWKSSNTKVVSVSKGKVTAKKAGTATVTMTANGVKDEVQVIVQNFTPTIALNQNEYTLYTTGKGNNVTLKATVDGTNKKVQWQSSNSSIAQVNTKGKVTAKGKGRALITATANGVTAKCWVSVREPDIIMEKNELILKPNEKVNLYEYVSVEVIGASQSVTYTSSDKKIATVNAKGLVTAKKEGTAVITLKANGAEKTCNVTVSTCEEHTFGPVNTVREPSCEENGLKEKECTVCGGKEQEVTDPSGHSFGKWTVVTKATENAAGLQRQVCVTCGAENTKIIPAKNKGELAYGYKLEWEDDFNGEELDRSTWNVETHEPGWVNAELQEYVDSKENIYVEDGKLVIQAIKSGNTYTSGRINTKDHKDYTYGRFEVSAKVPSGKGFLPAFWMMPTDEGYYGQWPKCGEIDIMEVMGQETNKLYSTLHFGEPHTQTQGTYVGEADFSEDFHVYACEWDPDEFRFYVDNQLFYTVNDWFTKKSGFGETAFPAPYDQPFYMILNLAVGGEWVGYPDESTKFEDNAQLVVDYVRVYQKDEYDTDVDKPEKEEVILRDPDENGNYIINGDFAIEEDLESGNWQLLTASGGEATAEIKENALHITTTAAGTENHSVQIVQAGLPIEKGNQYKLTYDAYADEGRTMITDISAPDRAWSRYLTDTTVTLTTEKQSYEHIFDMTSDDDANGRLEFNLGNQGSTAKVHISNVKLVKTDEKVDVPDDKKGVLPDGNYVYNGSFDEGNEGGKLRLAYWDWDIDKCKGASVSVTNDSKRELKVVVPDTVSALEDVVVYQESIAITGGKTYELSFDAYADREKTIKTTIAGETFISDLTADKQTFSYNLNTAEGLNGSEFRFMLGSAGTTYIDNVSIKEDGLIVNGDFSSGMVGYEVFVQSPAKVTDYIVDNLNGEDNAFSIDIADTGDQDWYIQLKQSNIKLEKGKWYKIGFEAKSTVDRKIKYALQRDGNKHNDDWTQYSKTPIIDLTKDYQNFSHKFMMAEDTDPEAVLSITMGAVSGQISTPHTIKIDNITLEETDPEEIQEGENLIQNGDFADGVAYWESVIAAPGVAKDDFTDGKAVYSITNVGEADWNVQLKQNGLTLEKGAEYKVSFKIKSSVARTVTSAIMNYVKGGNEDGTDLYDWYNGVSKPLIAGQEETVTYDVVVGEKETSNTIQFVISMGKIGDEVISEEHTIEIDDVRVVKIGGTGGDTEEEPIEPVEPGTELIKNGNFSDGIANWVENPNAEEGEATFKVVDDEAVFEITNVGTKPYSVQLKQEGLTLEKGASYEVKFNVESSVARDVIFEFQEQGGDWPIYAEKTISLEAGVNKAVKETITIDKASSKNILFFIGMGKIGDTAITDSHTIKIDDVSVIKVSGSGDEGDGETIEGNLIKNGNFADGETGWTTEIGGTAEAEVDFSNGKAVYTITNVGSNDWDIKLKQTDRLTLEKGAKYKVSFKIKSGAARTVKSSFMYGDSDYYGGHDPSLVANVEKTVEYEFTVDKETSEEIVFAISMGKIDGEETPASAIEIDDISVVKVGGTGGDTEEEPIEPVEPNTEMIQNGDFSKGKEDWTESGIIEDGAGTESFEDEKAVYEITNVGTQDWHVQLKQTDLTLEKGASYKVSFKIKSTEERTVKLKLQNPNDYSAYYYEKSISLNGDGDQTVEEEFTVNADSCNSIIFVIAMGKIDDKTIPTHTIEIDDVSLVKVSGDTEEKPIEPVEPNTEMIQNGDFSKGKEDWTESGIIEDGDGTESFDGEKAVYEITNVGTADWHVQLKQTGLTLEKGSSYKVSFKIKSTAERTVKLKLQNPNNYSAYYYEKSISLSGDGEQTVEEEFTVNADSCNSIIFVIAMGKIDDKTISTHTIEIDDVSLVKVSDTDETSETTSEASIGLDDSDEATTTPPANKSDDDTKDDADDAEEVQVDQDLEDGDEDDQNPEDQEDISDGKADDEDADSAKTESGDLETSEAQDSSEDE